MTGGVLIHRRILRAPRELVLRCLTEPAELAHLWGPRGTSTAVEDLVVELHPGGRFETRDAREHGSRRMVATFTEVAARDASLPVDDLLDQLRSPGLHGWQPPGAVRPVLSHAVIHSLDVTIALDLAAVAPAAAATAVLDQLADGGGAVFGIDLTEVRLEATDTGWSWGDGQPGRRRQRALDSLLSGRALPDGRRLPRT